MEYQSIVLGAGPGGYVCALRLAQLGQKVALVEERYLGGTCLNAGCVPTKSLLREAALGRNIAALTERRDAVAANQRNGVESLMKAAGVDVYLQTGKVVQGPAVELADGSILKAEAVIVATGAKPSIPPIPGADLPGVITSDDILCGAMPDVKRLVIIGGGVIGVELASVYKSLGANVTIIEALPRLLANMDREIGQSLAMQYKKDGITVVTKAKVNGIAQEGDELVVTYEAKKEETIAADAVLIATGRRAVVDGVFADDMMPELERGTIVTNDRFETSVFGVYAIGDVRGGIQLAHYATAQAKALAAQLAGEAEEMDLSLIPACVYTTPEVATVGMDAAQAKEAGIETITGKFIMGGHAKTVIDELPRSFIKLIFRADDHRLIGGVLYCGRASDLISTVTIAIRCGMTAEQMAGTIFAHPTYGEGLGEAAEVALGKCVHVVQR